MSCKFVFAVILTFVGTGFALAQEDEVEGEISKEALDEAMKEIEAEKVRIAGLQQVRDELIIDRAAQIADKTLRKYSPSEYYILHLGLTAAPIDAALRMRIPLPENQENYLGGVPCEVLIHLTEMTEAEQDAILQNLLPPKVLIGTRVVVIQRVLDEGKTMSDLMPIIMRFVNKHRKYPLEFSFIAKPSIKKAGLGEILKSSEPNKDKRPELTIMIDAPLVDAIVKGEKPRKFAHVNSFQASAASQEYFEMTPNPNFTSTISEFRRVLKNVKFPPVTYYYGQMKSKIEFEFDTLRAAVTADKERYEQMEARERITEDNVINAALDHAGHIMDEFPPNKYFIINFGVPATLNSAAFRGLLPDHAMRARYYAEITVENIKDLESFSREKQLEFFRRVMPPKEVIGDRKIVLHRTSWLGKSSTILIPAMAEYIRTEYPGREAAYYYVFFNTDAEERVEGLFEENKDVFSDGIFDTDALYAKTVNLGLKLTPYAENLATTVREVMEQPKFKFRKNPDAADLDARVDEVIAGGGKLLKQVMLSASECATAFGKSSASTKKK
jgi:hypothetical protein